MMPWKWYFRWYNLWPAALGCGAIPLMLAFFFCRFCRGPVRALQCVVYMALSFLLMLGERSLGLSGSPGLILETLLLAVWGKVCLDKSRSRSVAVAVLLLSVYGAVSGVTSWTERRVFFPLIAGRESMDYLWDGLRETVRAACLLGALTLALRRFGKMVEEADERVLTWLAVPVFFLSMVERIIRNSIYGDSLIMDTESGQVTTVMDINHGEMLVLQIFACLCLFLAMASCQKIAAVLKESEGMSLLRQQIRAEEIYVQEAETRLRQTQGFRHDIKNHLLVLSELLRGHQEEEAAKYLEKLEQVASGLSMEFQTGNGAVSALLGSKLSAARLEEIRVQCDLAIPEDSGIEDIDWCVLLSNAVDNAIKACGPLPREGRYLKIKSQRKGNFYLITVENSCDGKLTKPPGDGTGLSNIRATVRKYGGRVDNSVSDGVYRLRLLFTTKTPRFTSEP